MKKDIFKDLQGKLIVSCQAEGESPFNSPEGVTMMALAAKQGGASAIRSEGIDKTRMIINKIGLPVIGLIKSYFPDGYVKITGSFKEVEELFEIGCNIIAIDGTFRERENLTGPEFISKIKKNYDCIVMADISMHEEAVECEKAGADCVSTTLSGYTPLTQKNNTEADFKLVEKLVQELSIPVIAEGRINSPVDAAKMISLGAWAVVVGSAITRPNLITQWYVDKISGVKK